MKILVGIATTNQSNIVDGKIVKNGPDRRFIESIPQFFNAVGRKYPDIQIDTMWVWNKPLVEAQNLFADRVLDMGYDYLLTLEDDHWGHTVEMFTSLLEANLQVVGIPYRSRHFPFYVVPMKLKKISDDGIRKYEGMGDDTLSGYQECDLLGFGMTLIKSDCFRILDRPYFRRNIDGFKGEHGPHATDIDFCVRLQDKGIKVYGCFDHRINHRDIQEDRYKEMIVDGILTQHSMFNAIENIGRHKRIAEKFNQTRKENEKLKEMK